MMQIPPLPENELQRLKALSERSILDTLPEERFDRLTRLARYMFDVKIALVSLVDADRQWFKSHDGLDVCETPRSISFCGYAILSDEVFVVPNALEDSRFSDNPLVVGAPYIRFYAGAPLKTVDGYNIGSLCIIDDKPREMSEREIHALRDFADCVENEINQENLEKQKKALKQSQQIEEAVIRAQAAYIYQSNDDAIFNGLLDDILKLTNSEYGFIAKIESDSSGVRYLEKCAIKDTTPSFYNNESSFGAEFSRLEVIFNIKLTSEELVIANKSVSTDAEDPILALIPLNNFVGIPVFIGHKMAALVGLVNCLGGYDQTKLELLRPIMLTIAQFLEASGLRKKVNEDQVLLDRLSRAVGQSTNGMIITDAHGCIEWVNEGFTRITGYKLEDLRGRKPGGLLQGSESNPEAIAKMRHAQEERKPFEVEIVNYDKSGKPYWIEITCSPLFGPQGELQGFMAIESDITERKATEEKLKSATAILEVIVENIPHMIYLKRANDLCFEFINRPVEMLLNRSRAQILGKQDHDLFPKDRADFFVATDIQVLTQKELMVMEEENFLSSNGEIILQTKKLPLLDESGNPKYLLGIAEDITQRRQAEKALIIARDEAEQANRAKSEFLSSMSHELRTPLNAILGFGQLLEYDKSLNEEQQENVDAILKAGYHLLELINEILDLARIESGRISLSIEPVEVSVVLDECLNLISTLATKRNVQVKCTDPKGVVIKVDRTRFKQVILNLLSNAIKYNREGGQVAIELFPTDKSRLRIGVTDTGRGIAPERIAELFQPFNRLGAEAVDIEGTGIGLTITRKIIEMMDGVVEVESEVDVGSTFWIELPMEPLSRLSANPESTCKTTVNMEGDQDLAFGKRTVLYIEDNPLNIKLVNQILARREYINLLTALTPELGLELARTQSPALILLDINMPGMDGYQVMEILKKDDSLKSIPVIALTANAMPHDIKRGRAAGFDEYLTKPLDVPLFLESVDHHLGVSMEN